MLIWSLASRPRTDVGLLEGHRPVVIPEVVEALLRVHLVMEGARIQGLGFGDWGLGRD